MGFMNPFDQCVRHDSRAFAHGRDWLTTRECQHDKEPGGGALPAVTSSLRRRRIDFRRHAGLRSPSDDQASGTQA